MNAMIFIRMIMTGVSILIFQPSIAGAAAPIPYHTQKLVFKSGMHDGRKKIQTFVVFSEVVKIPEAPWLRLQFSDHNLGEKSFITITSLKDGEQQRLNAITLRQWQNKSAFFNGDAVEVELHANPADKEIFFEIGTVMVGDRGRAEELSGFASHSAVQPDIEAICGGVDDRVASSNPAVGRIVPVGCTGWIISNGAYLTAGHCVGPSMQTLQFNVPASDDDGMINHPPPKDQYPVNLGNVDFINGGVGNDWAVFDAIPNADTDLLPVRAQKAFFRMSRDSSASETFRIPGYGVDGPPPCFGSARQPECRLNKPPRNTNNQTLQTHTGSNKGVSRSGLSVSFKYEVDTQGGNSGSPIALDGQILTVGIHTNGGCSSRGGSNAGTSFENNDLEESIQTFFGENIIYVDKGHPISMENGTIFRPFYTVTEAINAVTAGGIVSIVAGSYKEMLTISKSMTLMAPVGTVSIGD